MKKRIGIDLDPDFAITRNMLADQQFADAYATPGPSEVDGIHVGDWVYHKDLTPAKQREYALKRLEANGGRIANGDPSLVMHLFARELFCPPMFVAKFHEIGCSGQYWAELAWSVPLPTSAIHFCNDRSGCGAFHTKQLVLARNCEGCPTPWTTPPTKNTSTNYHTPE